MHIIFSAKNFQASSSIGTERSTFPSADRIGMTLLAHTESGIELPNGVDISQLEISFQIMSPAHSETSLRTHLQTGSVGFLTLICEDGNKPLVHGAMLWDREILPYFLFQAGISATVNLMISNVEPRVPWDDPYIWHPGKSNQLIIESASIESTLEMHNGA